jgi:cell division protein YceG involved in septum cleavage
VTDPVYITIRVNSGESSGTVCARMAAAGLIESATDFNNYLIDNNYNRRIRAGTHEILQGSDYATMAAVLMSGGR